MRIPHLPSVDTVTCLHETPCPPYGAPDHDAAHPIAYYPLQGWALLCNGVILFDDTGELSPLGVATAPHRPEVHLERVPA
jgi:hypothetical protein